MSYCSLSGYFTNDPVLLRKSGYIFDRNIIKKYVTMFKRCPISYIPSKSDDIILCKVLNQANKLSHKKNSINLIIDQLKEHWERNSILVFRLKNNLLFTRQELIYSYYQVDIACRTIAKISKEKMKLWKTLDIIRKLLSHL